MKKRVDPPQAPAGSAPAAQDVTVTKTPEPAPAPKVERKVTPISPIRFKEVPFLWNRWGMTAHENTEPTDLLKPEYWAHVSAQLRPRDEIIVWADDGSWRAEVAVLGSDRNWARVALVSVQHLTTVDVSQTQADAMSPYSVEYKGPHTQWSVIRKSDQSIVHEGAPTKYDADEWLRGRLKAER